ncbi:phenylalanine--tRNA ligase subunit beta [Patescibacteria group bacterium]
MDLIIPDSWLREFLKTKATSKQIAKCVSLSGPSFEKISKAGGSLVYSVEVTTNRVDSASVYGIAREASAILPRYGIKATLSTIKPKCNVKFVKKVNYLSAVVDNKLCFRFTAVLIKNVNIKPSPKWMQERLKEAGVRPINNVVDISNYIMHELGQPVHTFDYDKIKNQKMILRASKKGEEITTLDGKKHSLLGGDIVIEDGERRLIDLAGIMGGENSAVDAKTKNVLLFVQTYNPVNIRKTYMQQSQRTDAAVLFEKDLDTELVEPTMKKAIDLFNELTNGTHQKEILDIYPNPYKVKKVVTNIDFINKVIGINIAKKDITKILQGLGFETLWKGNNLSVLIPSFRAKDINIPEDIVEEIARIYGYYNLTAKLMPGEIPGLVKDTIFDFENKIKNILKGFGGTEVYTPSLVSGEQVEANALKLTNPLGAESEYLRNSFLPSLVNAAKQNSQEAKPFFLFEVANIYIPKKENLPDEKLMLGVIFSNTSYRKMKGVAEALLDELHIKAKFVPEDAKFFIPSKRVTIEAKKQKIGILGILEKKNLGYFEFPIKDLLKLGSDTVSYKSIPKYPPQIEDITLSFPAKTRIGDVLEEININSENITASLANIYKGAYTFNVRFLHPTKTLTNKDVEKIRNKMLQSIKSKFGALLKT